MRRPLSLSPRLLALAQRVPRNARVADIGTDHGRLPVYLAERGITRSVVASDLRPGPLEAARKLLKAHRLDETVTLRLSDGLRGIAPEEAEVIVIAGLGGDTIAQILRDSPWVKAKTLLLQPMTHTERVTEALEELVIPVRERIRVAEGKKLYTILRAGGTTMSTVRDVVNALEELAPLKLAVKTDNVGLLCGHWDAEVRRVLVSLDVTLRVIEEAAEVGAQMIIAHHPILWQCEELTDATARGKRLLALAENRLAALCMHTNLDVARQGLNYILAEKAGLTGQTAVPDVHGTYPDGTPYGFGLYGELPEAVPVLDYAARMKQVFGSKTVRFHDAGKPVKTLAVGSGSSATLLDRIAALGCDTLLTGDIKHNFWLDAQDYGVNLIDCGHFPTENFICEWIAKILSERFPGVEFRITERHTEPFEAL